MTFLDRREAGRLLARKLLHLRGTRPLVLSVAPPAIEIAALIAEATEGELDILLAGELRPVGVAERSPGAVAEGGAPVVVRGAARALGVGPVELGALVAARRTELERHGRACRGGRAPPDPRGRTVVVVTDGLNGTLAPLAAVRAVRAAGPDALFLATPVAEASALAGWRAQVDELVVLEVPDELLTPGYWYRHPAHPSDDDVSELIERCHRRAVEEAAAAHERRWVGADAHP